jgi:hypothetical protein
MGGFLFVAVRKVVMNTIIKPLKKIMFGLKRSLRNLKEV